MSTVVVTYENRHLPFKEKFRANHAEYCSVHQYAYIPYDTHTLDKTIPPYWLKVFIVRELLDVYDTVMWIDSDATFKSRESIRSKCPEGSIMSISADKPQHRIPGKINTGVFIVHKDTIPMMDAWIDLYDASYWYRRDDGSWQCSGKWAGTAYEQGALATMIDARVQVYPWYVMNNHPKSGHDGFVNHFCGTVGKRMLIHT